MIIALKNKKSRVSFYIIAQMGGFIKWLTFYFRSKLFSWPEYQSVTIRSSHLHQIQDYAQHPAQARGSARRVSIKLPKPDNLQPFAVLFQYNDICGKDKAGLALCIRSSNFARHRSATWLGRIVVFFRIQQLAQTAILIAKVLGNHPEIREKLVDFGFR